MIAQLFRDIIVYMTHYSLKAVKSIFHSVLELVFPSTVMPKHQVSCSERTKEFKEEGYIVSAGVLLCKHCNCHLDYKRKDALDKHCKSEKHTK